MENPTEQQPLTPEEQRALDRTTTLVLAGCMVSTFQLMQARAGAPLAKMMLKVGTLLNQDPSFTQRLAAAQIVAMEKYNELMKLRPTPPAPSPIIQPAKHKLILP